MSVNLDISFEIHNIESIHRTEDKSLKKAIITATEKFLKHEGIGDQGLIVDFLGQEGYLAAYTTHPIIISRSYIWVPEVTQKWEAMAKSVLGNSCVPKVVVDYLDEES